MATMSRKLRLLKHNQQLLNSAAEKVVGEILLADWVERKARRVAHDFMNEAMRRFTEDEVAMQRLLHDLRNLPD